MGEWLKNIACGLWALCGALLGSIFNFYINKTINFLTAFWICLGSIIFTVFLTYLLITFGPNQRK